MPTRRTFLRASAATLLAAGGAALARAQSRERPVYLPVALRGPAATATPLPIPTPAPTATPIPGDPAPPTYEACILAPPCGTAAQALAWLAPRADASYTDFDLTVIIEAYRATGERVGADWFMALAQMAHETASLTSFWSLRPQRNPAGIGVTGQWSDTPPANPAGWAYNFQRERWEAGVSFATWADDAVPAHLGRLLAYALRHEDANIEQRALIAKALAYRPFPAARRGIAPRWLDLNGKWAVPGTTYGQSIVNLARRMRGDAALPQAAGALDSSGADDGDWMPAEG